ncbi:hypothetical protein HFN_1897 [Helicobacter fennelliae MRY12-0050]|uniref:Uncharacterized protein n=1 Tax=Helicobacter fennelliae MRY12-0050 TaxID=1325130 RepID=T1CND3_9HELI|nr:hypothetical protein HFN_1897 [Helicobacter fennelliae MRY12-0050]
MNKLSKNQINAPHSRVLQKQKGRKSENHKNALRGLVGARYKGEFL